jgi:hypothetical protein
VQFPGQQGPGRLLEGGDDLLLPRGTPGRPAPALLARPPPAPVMFSHLLPFLHPAFYVKFSPNPNNKIDFLKKLWVGEEQGKAGLLALASPGKNQPGIGGGGLGERVRAHGP